MSTHTTRTVYHSCSDDDNHSLVFPVALFCYFSQYIV